MAGRDDSTNGTAESQWHDGLEQTTGPEAGEPGTEEAGVTKPAPGTPGQGGTTAASDEGDGTAMRTAAPPEDT